MKRAKLLFGVLVIGMLISLASCTMPFEPQPTFMPEDVAGAWRADYSQFTVPDVSLPVAFDSIDGVETVVLMADGTFQQTFSGDREETTYGAWTIDVGDILHLEGAKTYTYGLQFADRLANGQARASVDDCHGQPIEISGADLMLCVRPDRNTPGLLILQHLEIGDPDSPQVVTFYRVPQ